ncbi:hypothetical protein F2P56_036704 [Juglans regia]|uniref:Transcription factor bHLH143-like n=2 Tax=Juglans regia TaxID=51240 RepID=A0A2I4HEY9_JUGRE|nr:transcription factor bHLH143-like [Juglans regia]XP_018854722.1 transcription factor bHLH143-like [Juglans regia]XP_018854723.1 transcription factor bHLH143-like [Juglans regia]XP_035542360.1 transcription factor bHLH143-like [Juglans regia]XP_035542363.1 transcription factor bHLH143-like [Juglans regia]XP_035542364.1 transcription factor bHLH143-like [Juglans regia]XP_035542365.1 transcription factor bHLH143-like [Juglans regia]XP_035542366.1 transcription factor bHLH143-like [Juglans re
MVMASKSRLSLENSAWKPSKLSFMNTDLRPRQQECLPACTNPGNRMSPAPMAQPNFAVPGIPDLKTEQTNGAHGSLQCLPHQCQGLLPIPDPYLKTKKSMLSNSGSSAKRFLIFDQCGNQTRLIYNSFCFPSPNPNTAAKPICFYYGEEQAARVSQIDPSKYILHEASGENITTFEESEMHEDTEEINALLYSDNDEYGDGDDDETASTGHSPMAIKGGYKKYDHVDYLTDEVAGPDSPNKRQKLLDGGYKKSSPMATTSSVRLDRSVEYGSDAESGYAFGQNQGEKAGSILGKMCFRRDKIYETLRILERIIPGAEGKDPLFVIDEAIDYLKILKLNAKSLGVNNQ